MNQDVNWGQGISAGASGISAAGSIYSGYLAKEAYGEEAELVEEEARFAMEGAEAEAELVKETYGMEADLAELEADYQEELGEFYARRKREKGRAIKGSQKAQIAAQGGTIGRGSALEVLAHTAAEVELDALMEEHKGKIKAGQAERESARLRRTGEAEESALIRGGTMSALRSREKAGRYERAGQAAWATGLAKGGVQTGKLLTGATKFAKSFDKSSSYK